MVSHYAINPDPYRKRAVARLDDDDPKVKALAQVVIVMCDAYDGMRAALDIEPGEIVEWSYQRAFCGCKSTCGDDMDVDGPGTCKGLPCA